MTASHRTVFAESVLVVPHKNTVPRFGLLVKLLFVHEVRQNMRVNTSDMNEIPSDSLIVGSFVREDELTECLRRMEHRCESWEFTFQQISYGFFEIKIPELHYKVDWSNVSIGGKVVVFITVLKKVKTTTVLRMKRAVATMFKVVDLGFGEFY